MVLVTYQVMGNKLQQAERGGLPFSSQRRGEERWSNMDSAGPKPRKTEAAADLNSALVDISDVSPTTQPKSAKTTYL